MIPWETYGGLTLDRDGHLWERYRDGWHWFGPIEDCEVPARLEAARDRLFDLWRDSFDDRGEQEWSYRLRG